MRSRKISESLKAKHDRIFSLVMEHAPDSEAGRMNVLRIAQALTGMDCATVAWTITLKYLFRVRGIVYAKDIPRSEVWKALNDARGYLRLLPWVMVESSKNETPKTIKLENIPKLPQDAHVEMFRMLLQAEAPGTVEGLEEIRKHNIRVGAKLAGWSERMALWRFVWMIVVGIYDMNQAESVTFEKVEVELDRALGYMELLEWVILNEPMAKDIKPVDGEA